MTQTTFDTLGITFDSTYYTWDATTLPLTGITVDVFLFNGALFYVDFMEEKNDVNFVECALFNVKMIEDGI